MWNIFQIFENFRRFSEILKISKIPIENPIGNFQNVGNFENFGKSSIFSENISHFFTIWDGFFMDFQNFWCSVKRTCPLLIRILYLFMKCASKCSIIEIYQNGTKKVALFDNLLDIGTHLIISSELWGTHIYTQIVEEKGPGW